MAIRNYVLSKYLSGSGSDFEIDVMQMTSRNSYNIDDPTGFIAECIFNALETYIDLRYRPDFIKKLLDKDGQYKLLVSEDSSVVSDIVLTSDNESQIYSYDLKGDIKIKQVYEVSQIDDETLGYIVSEHIVAPSASCHLIERCYRPYFDDMTLAQRYLSKQMKDYSVASGNKSLSGYRLFVVDIDVLEKSHWYQANVKAAKDIEKYKLEFEDYRYIEHIDDVSASILADAYDSLPLADQADANLALFDSIRDFLDEEIKDSLTVDIDSAMDEEDYPEVEAIADSAILFALIMADSKETFDKIHSILGPYDYRVGALTDEIYNKHPDSGYILLSREAELSWYPECDFINSWDGARDSVYHGKFMRNENDTLLCLREYHPELIVEELPSDMELMKYKRQYTEYMSVTRGKHEEMHFDVEDGIPVCRGDWYPRGLSDQKCYKGTMFSRMYFDYKFSTDMCKKLLSGEEIVIDDYVSKEGILSTIRGKLKDVSGPFDDDAVIGFSRTDIGSKARLMLNSELQIDEPGLPTVNEV